VILIIEGPSAAGKSTAALRLGAGALVPEAAGLEPPAADALTVATFWAEANSARWELAVETERRDGRAVCDTDPLKLHYDYCRFRIGQLEQLQLVAGAASCRRLIEQRRLGIADLILCSIPDGEVLRRQREGDTTRSRRRFELHRQLAVPLRDWYAALEAIDPSRVEWTFPTVLPSTRRRDRYDVDLFDDWMRLLEVPA
jgi:hypothetical protein